MPYNIGIVRFMAIVGFFFGLLFSIVPNYTTQQLIELDGFLLVVDGILWMFGLPTIVGPLGGFIGGFGTGVGLYSLFR